MTEHLISCPCCNEKIKVIIDDSGAATAFLLDKNGISQNNLFQKYGIELGVVESEVKK